MSFIYIYKTKLSILRDLRHMCVYIYQCVVCQLRTKPKTRDMIGRCNFIECVVRRKFS